MKALTGKTRQTLLLFFASHIPITLCMDIQAVFGMYYPRVLRNLTTWYVDTFQDALMRDAPVWFQSLVVCEFFLQVPFFVTACYFLGQTPPPQNPSKINNDSKDEYHYPNWFRDACIVYGSHTATTLVPILCAILTNPETVRTQKMVLCGFYVPYLVFPLWILYLAVMSQQDHHHDVSLSTKTKIG
jgi:hypothetical protein